MRRRHSRTIRLLAAATLVLVAGACTEPGDGDGDIDVVVTVCATEGAAEYCYPGPATARGVGLCVDGTSTCTGGVWSECEGYTLPVDELCDDLLDNNCNGVDDEGCPCEPGEVRPCYTGPSAARGIGLCVAGEQRCVAGSWGTECVGEVLPAAAEECNELDDDCNGILDDGCACVTGASRDCYTGAPDTRDVGPCRQGSQSCTSGQWETTCTGEITPEPETCNLVDDDCDGSADEELGTTTCGTGPCANTVPSCVGGVVQGCEPLCDGVSCTAGSQCATGFCKDGRCCNTACTNPCFACGTGTCKSVTNGFDDPECTGTNRCDSAGSCKKVDGQSCGSASECVSGYCKDGRCCNSSCTTACRSCASGSCSTVSSADDNPECTGANSCNANGVCQAESPFYTNSFEATGDFSTWIVWHNCEEDSDWRVQRAAYPASGGGSWAVRFQSTTFLPSCNWPGAYAQSPDIAVTGGATYRLESWSRNTNNVGQTAVVFFDAADQQVGFASVPWSSDAWQYNANPSLVAVAPASATHLQIRLGLTSPAAVADIDLLALYRDP